MSSSESARIRVEQIALQRQHGAIFRRDALAAGMTSPQIKRRVHRRQWLPLGPRGWYVIAAETDNPLAALVAGTRALSGPAWADSALALFELAQHPTEPIIASNRRHTGQGAKAVHVTRLAQLPQTTVAGIQTVTAAVAVVAAGRWLRSDLDLHLLVDTAIRAGVTSWDEVEKVLEYFPHRGRAGSTKMRQVRADHELDPALPLSNWGREFMYGILDTDLPRPKMEFRVLDGAGNFVAQVDAAYPRRRYAIELDSHAHHLNPTAFEVDRRRDGDLAQLGWLVRRFTWDQWHRRRPWVVATIRADLRSRDQTAQNT